MERLKAEKRRFDYREKTLLGFVTNAIALIRPGMQRTGKGLLPMLFTLLVSGEQRRQLIAAKHALATKGAFQQTVRQPAGTGREDQNRPRRPA